MLRFLETASAQGDTDFAHCARTFTAREPRSGMALVLTDGYDFSGLARGLDALRYARFEPALLLLVDPREEAPALHGELTLVDAESGELRTVTITASVLERYRQARRQHFAALSTYCREKGVRCFELNVQQAFDEAALDLLKRGGLLT
jgi:hypothetical protein